LDEPNAHPWIWLVYAILFSAVVPWYLPAETGDTTLFGFPTWVTISLLASFCVALFTVFVIGRYWDGGPDDP